MSTTTKQTDTDAAATAATAAAADKAACDGYIESGLKSNPTIQFLMEKLINMGCEPPKGFMKCINCNGMPASGGFGMLQEEILHDNPNESTTTTTATTTKHAPHCQTSTQDLLDYYKRETNSNDKKTKLSLAPEVYLCQEHVANTQHAHNVLIHELIHAIDACRAKMDPIHNCTHLACSEIRAEHLSGECNVKWEVLRGQLFTNYNFSLIGHGQECVKRRAIDSVKANPKCAAKAEQYVNEAMDRCYKDIFPFTRHPNLDRYR